MKKAMTAALVVGCAALTAGGWAGYSRGPGDEEAIRARTTAFAAAWNKHDTAAIAAFWSADGDLINPWGREAKGRPAVETLFKDEHGGAMKASRFEYRVTNIRILGTSGVAVVDWSIDLTGVVNPEGSALPPMPHHVALVMQKAKDGTWMIEAARPYVLLTPPEKMDKDGTPKK